MFLDTSGLLCLLDPDERFHERALDLYANATVRVTHNYVLAELIALSYSRRRPASSTLNFVMKLITHPEEVQLLWADERLTSQSLILLKSHFRAGYSLCDAASFVVMRQRGLTSALTMDKHFEQEGFQRLLA
jgi:uncharacterized protein